MGLLVEVGAWHQALLAFAVVWPPLTAHQGVQDHCSCTEQREWWYHAYTNDSTEKWVFKVEVNAPLILLCLLYV